MKPVCYKFSYCLLLSISSTISNVDVTLLSVLIEQRPRANIERLVPNYTLPIYSVCHIVFTLVATSYIDVSWIRICSERL